MGHASGKHMKVQAPGAMSCTTVWSEGMPSISSPLCVALFSHAWHVQGTSRRCHQCYQWVAMNERRCCHDWEISLCVSGMSSS